jgi:hypothetical protein
MSSSELDAFVAAEHGEMGEGGGIPGAEID